MGDERGMGAALLGLGNLDLGRGDFESARARYDASLEHFRRARNERGIGLMRSNVGRLEELRGDLVAALPLLSLAVPADDVFQAPATPPAKRWIDYAAGSDP